MIPHPVQIRLLPERQRKLANLLHACIWDAVTPICWDSSRRLRSTDTTDYVVWRTRTKIAVLVFQCLTGQAPGNLARRRCQRSPTSISRHATCITRRTSNIFSDRCFAAADPRPWNSLPINLRQCHSLKQFQRLLKTFLFTAWGHGALWHLLQVTPLVTYKSVPLHTLSGTL